LYGPEIESEDIYEGKPILAGRDPSETFSFAAPLLVTHTGMPRDAEAEAKGSRAARTLVIYQDACVLRLHADRPAVPTEAVPPTARDAPRTLLHQLQLTGHDRVADGYANNIGVGGHGDAKIDTALRNRFEGMAPIFSNFAS
jgi:hypothetical protein